MPTEVSKIESIIKTNLEDETQKSIAQLKETVDTLTKQAIERINNVYGSAISTLRKLELTDATIFDFFEKTQGNIRVAEVKNDWHQPLRALAGNIDVLHPNPIYLKKARYKIIVMAIEVKEEKE